MHKPTPLTGDSALCAILTAIGNFSLRQAVKATSQSKVACSEADGLRALLALHAIALGSLTQGVCLYDAEYRIVLFNRR
jgi:hypothetical protein